MLARIDTCTLLGVDAVPIRVEVHLTTGLPSFSIVGLAHGAVREGRERVTAALANSGFELPLRRITVNLAPADQKKSGSGFDLAIALGILCCSGQLRTPDDLSDTLVLGELGLDGRVRGVPGALPAAVLARAAGVRRLVVPAVNAAEAQMMTGVDVWGVASLRGLVEALARNVAPRVRARGPDRLCRTGKGPDLAEVRGHAVARRALEISAAGGHNLLMVGPPGIGKTMLARCVPAILPRLSRAEVLEVARVRSATALNPPCGPVERPFRAPHHTVSYAGLVGGGRRLQPGEVSLAHRGVLFLDELPEFDRRALESLRQPLEEGAITLSRAEGRVRLPARFILIGAMNPCPCGYRGDGTDRCRCDDRVLDRYRRRVSGPLIDRIDVRVELDVPEHLPFEGECVNEPSAEVQRRVEDARERQRVRYELEEGVECNAEAHGPSFVRSARPDPAGADLLRTRHARDRMSARGVDRVLRVGRTIADLEGDDRVREHHMAEALHYREPLVLRPD